MRYLTGLFFIALTIVLSACSTKKQTAEKHWQSTFESYKSKGTELFNYLGTPNRASKDEKFIKKSAETLVRDGKFLIQQLALKTPKCKNYLNQVLEGVPKMLKMSHEDIEHHFHAGYSLPEADSICMEIKELVVHPATVSILIRSSKKKSAYGAMADELEEVINHIDNIEFLLQGKFELSAAQDS